MEKSEHIVRYTADELREMRERGEILSDRARVDVMTEEELEAAIASDPDEADWAPDWTVSYPGPVPTLANKQQITLRIDADILDWFRSHGKGYQTYINAVLRRHVNMEKLNAERAKRANGNPQP